MEQSNPNSVNVDKSLQTEGDIALGVNGVYQALRSTNCVGEGASLWTDDRADDINTTDNQSNNGEPFQFTAFSLVASNTWLQSHWTALYLPIARANLILSAIGKITFADDKVKSQYVAELKFLRAFMYFNLVREFGGVPLVTERLNTLDDVNRVTFRETRENVYAQIIKDLVDVVGSNLPNVQPAANKGRVSLQAANGLLGQVYLTMATTLDAANKTANLNQAKTYLLACYNMRGFGKLSDIPFADVFDVNKKSTNQEIIFQIVYKQGDPTYRSSLAASNQAKGETINSLAVSQGAGGPFTNDLLKEFETGDLRTDFSIKYANDPSVKAYFITKFRDNSAAATNLGYGGNDWILIRYADVILNLAEVFMYLNDNATAISYLDMVRARAARPLYATMLGDAAYAARYPTLKLAILHERRIELAFEHHRWHDLTRFFNKEELVAYFKGKSQADYNNSPLSNITTKDYYFPIPLNEYKLNPAKMPQNPGYE
ncbi:RagB/SusD family nutrient uptake outer membrane protein [Paraflavitalea speifideaquila]|uniref:RagB/SusD family nutrient uptake outer membrane protein n=1 Tax=Paraflavitalea speifideaquila TaxID=3076558 RepID=UPI0028ECCF2F|nr:RagB/SusD family nutrient uptake outer membrane protein [Paraflavitalea speifideiaquila]